MLHAPVNETKNQTTQEKKPSADSNPQPQWHSLLAGGGATATAKGDWSMRRRATRPQVLSRTQSTYGNQAVLRMLNSQANSQQALQRAAKGTASSAPESVPPIVDEVLRSSGHPLDSETRSFMEQRFGHDFGNVTLHTDAKAAKSAEAVNALAYTVGHNVVFGEGQHAPHTSAGRQLLAHELTHVVQQRNASSLSRYSLGSSNDSCEHEAASVAEAVAANRALPYISAAMPGVQRQDAGDGGAPPADAAPPAPDAGGAPDAGAAGDGGGAPAVPPAPAPPAPPAPAAPVRVLRVEVEPGSRDHFAQVPGTGAGTHWVGVASTTAQKPIVQAVLDTAVPAGDPRLAGLTWSGPGVTPDPTNPLQAEVERRAGQRRVTVTLGGSSASTTLWAVFATISATAGPTRTFSSDATSASPGASINLQATIHPNSILTAADRPNLAGPNDTAPPGGTSPATGNALSGGADHHWDFSRKSRDRVINPSGIPLASFVVPGDAGQATIFSNVPWGYPATWEEGNDDSSPADETNDPYSAPMTSSDTPVDNLSHAAGANGDTFEDHCQFREFVRLEIMRRWWVISGMFPWRVHIRVRKTGGLWVDNGTDAAADNAGF